MRCIVAEAATDTGVASAPSLSSAPPFAVTELNAFDPVRCKAPEVSVSVASPFTASIVPPVDVTAPCRRPCEIVPPAKDTEAMICSVI